MKNCQLVTGSLLCLALFACSADPRDVSDTDQVTDTAEQDIIPDTAGRDTGDTETCQHWHYPQDYTYGEDCWAPPENLCRNGLDNEFSWYCNSDGSKCCITISSNCFYCDWIQCKPTEEGKDVSSECEALNIPQKYIDCGNMTEDCLPEVDTEMRNSGECAFTFIVEDPDYTYCWDDYL